MAVCARAGRAPLDVAAAFIAAGVRLLQVRGKALAGGELLALVDAVAERARPAGAAVVVNDRVDVAAAAAVGVHVGQSDLPAEVARRLLGPAALVGCSTHSLAELEPALAAPVSYVAYGPVFATATKANPDPVVGLDGLRAAARRAAAAGVPLVAIGGITLATRRGGGRRRRRRRRGDRRSRRRRGARDARAPLSHGAGRCGWIEFGGLCPRFAGARPDMSRTVEAEWIRTC